MVTKRFSRVHAVCARLRGKPCDGCPAWERHEDEPGRWQGMCYGLAQETINIAVHGNPWGAKAKKKTVRAWRKRWNCG